MTPPKAKAIPSTVHCWTPPGSPDVFMDLTEIAQVYVRSVTFDRPAESKGRVTRGPQRVTHYEVKAVLKGSGSEVMVGWPRDTEAEALAIIDEMRGLLLGSAE